MENIFEKVTRKKLRFHINGEISVEQLWSVNKETLIDYEARLEEEVEKFGKSNRRIKTTKSFQQADTELRLAVVKHIIDTKLAEEEALTQSAETKAHNAKIDELIAKKQEKQLEEMSVEDLLKLRK